MQTPVHLLGPPPSHRGQVWIVSTCWIPQAPVAAQRGARGGEAAAAVWVRWAQERCDAPASFLECSGLGFLGGQSPESRWDPRRASARVLSPCRTPRGSGACEAGRRAAGPGRPGRGGRRRSRRRRRTRSNSTRSRLCPRCRSCASPTAAGPPPRRRCRDLRAERGRSGPHPACAHRRPGLPQGQGGDLAVGETVSRLEVHMGTCKVTRLPA